MKDQLISFETAKLLSHTDFNYRDCDDGYVILNGELSHDFAIDYANRKAIPAPTQSLLQRWLREKYNIHVNASVNFYNRKPIIGYYYSLDRFNKDNIHDGIIYDDNQLALLGDKTGYETYEEALEAGLMESLKLIKL